MANRGIKKLFRNIPVTIFKVFKDLIVEATWYPFTQNLLDEDTAEPRTFNMIIVETLHENIDILRFNDIQPNDRLGYVRGVDIDFEIQNGDRIEVENKTYEVADQEILAADALYIFLLRKVG